MDEAVVKSSGCTRRELEGTDSVTVNRHPGSTARRNREAGIRRNRDYVKHVHPTDHDIRNFFDVDTKLGEMVLPHDATTSISQYLDKATYFFNDEVLDEKIGKT